MESSTIEEFSTKQKNDSIVDLFRGDVPLATTYWVFGVLFGNIGFSLILRNIYKHDLPMLKTPVGIWSMGLFFCFIVIYSLFISIAVWRSAGKYQGNKLWGILARATVALNLIWFLVGFLSGFQQARNKTDGLLAELDRINQRLPLMLDNDTRLDHIDMKDMNIYQNYTLVNLSTDQIDKDQFISIMSKEIKDGQCQDQARHNLMKDGMTFIFSYRDKAHQKVAEIPVVVSDCL